MTRLYIAILTHNALEYTKMCLASIANYTSINHEIYILDNASVDGSVEWLYSQKITNWHIFTSPTNIGVPKGRNALINRIAPTLPDNGFIVFLDNDVEVHTNWYMPFFQLFDQHPEVGIAGAMGHAIIVHDDRRELLVCPTGKPEQVDVVSGYCFWIRAEVLFKVGVFDENLGCFWHEDDDYCVRAINCEYKIFMVPDAQIVHYAHKSGIANETSSAEHSLKNQRYLVDKWKKLGFVDENGRISHRSSCNG